MMMSKIGGNGASFFKEIMNADHRGVGAKVLNSIEQDSNLNVTFNVETGKAPDSKTIVERKVDGNDITVTLYEKNIDAPNDKVRDALKAFYMSREGVAMLAAQNMHVEHPEDLLTNAEFKIASGEAAYGIAKESFTSGDARHSLNAKREHIMSDIYTEGMKTSNSQTIEALNELGINGLDHLESKIDHKFSDLKDLDSKVSLQSEGASDTDKADKTNESEETKDTDETDKTDKTDKDEKTNESTNSSDTKKERKVNILGLKIPEKIFFPIVAALAGGAAGHLVPKLFDKKDKPEEGVYPTDYAGAGYEDSQFYSGGASDAYGQYAEPYVEEFAGGDINGLINSILGGSDAITGASTDAYAEGYADEYGEALTQGGTEGGDEADLAGLLNQVLPYLNG
jgi:hypothetical protein